MSGRTEDEVEKAFGSAARMLRELKALGVREPWVKLFFDGSGEVHLGSAGDLERAGLTPEQVHDVVGSARTLGWPERSTEEAEADYTVRFCEVLFRERAPVS